MRYDVHGVTVAAEGGIAGIAGFPIARERPEATPAPAEVVIRAGDAWAVPATPPPGEIVAELIVDGTCLYVAADSGHADDGGIVLRVPSLCEFAISADRREVVVHPDPAADPASVPILLSGTVMALVLTIAGHTVLHASAVQHPASGAALAFVGVSGMGKSTLAALCGAAGARIVADDVLRVDVLGDPGGVVCYRGSPTLRLRPKAAAVAAAVAETGGNALARSADGRIVAAPVPAGPGPIPLGAVVVPRPSRQVTEVRIERLRGAKAAFALARFPRIAGGRGPAAPAAQLDRLALVAGRVPVYDAHVPWGPPFAPEIGPRLLELVQHADDG